MKIGEERAELRREAYEMALRVILEATLQPQRPAPRLPWRAFRRRRRNALSDREPSTTRRSARLGREARGGWAVTADTRKMAVTFGAPGSPEGEPDRWLAVFVAAPPRDPQGWLAVTVEIGRRNVIDAHAMPATPEDQDFWLERLRGFKARATLAPAAPGA